MSTHLWTARHIGPVPCYIYFMLPLDVYQDKKKKKSKASALLGFFTRSGLKQIKDPLFCASHPRIDFSDIWSVHHSRLLLPMNGLPVEKCFATSRWSFVLCGCSVNRSLV